MVLAKKHNQLPLDLGQLYASDITGAILAFLTHHGYTVWRQNTTGIYDPAKARWRVNPQGRRGVPDIIGFRKRDGLFIGDEGQAVGSSQLIQEGALVVAELVAAGFDFDTDEHAVGVAEADDVRHPSPSPAG